ncbi:HFL308Wp [Eremothecium sinecaudum]|uniref:HFL308Wp n=1 Tax=Eremothecium sinecaudum TaxID=45286 RepID=A0A0X8HUB2_9SACH|nr:HFL308Wp [Eremothecium sinecaudum]AMD21548.1 HFL308Wp [Eremothecium sinecaudum]
MIDLTIPPRLPPEAVEQLKLVIADFAEGNLTHKGYLSKRQYIIESAQQLTPTSKDTVSVVSLPHSSGSISVAQSQRQSQLMSSPVSAVESRNRSIMSTYRSQAANEYSSYDTEPGYSVTTSNSQRHSQNQGGLRNSCRYKLKCKDGTYKPMMPLLPRVVPQQHFTTESLPFILRSRSRLYHRDVAMIGVNARGKETSITWEKLYLKAEMVANKLGRSGMYSMDKVLLWYESGDAIEFAVALFGCFIAGVTAVPVSLEIYTLVEITEIVKLTNSNFVLISEECFKQIENLHTETSKLNLLKSGLFNNITFLKTEDLGMYTKAKKSAPTFDIPKVSYIEFTRTPLGKLSGIVMKHKVLGRQFENFADILNSRSNGAWKKGDVRRPYSQASKSAHPYVILSSLDPTRSTGLILGILFNVFSGNLLLCLHPSVLRKPGGYESIINKYRADILLNDQLLLKQVVINYLENPEVTISRRFRIDFSCIKWCVTSCTTIDTEVSDMIVHKWLKNLGCVDAAQAYSPMLTLLDFGGVFISVRDQIGKVDRFPMHDTKHILQDDVFIDKEKLKDGIVQPSIFAMINPSSSTKDYLRLATFGYPIMDAYACIVDPDTKILVEDLTVGEIWISAPSVTDEFYHMDKLTEFVFNAKLNFKNMISLLESTEPNCSQDTYLANMDRLTAIMSVISPDTPFLRTKIVGFIHNGKIYTLSLIEDMFQQNKLIRLGNWAHTSDLSRGIKIQPKPDNASVITDKRSSASLESNNRVVQIFYFQHISENLVRAVDKVSEVAAFEMPTRNDEHLLVIVVESPLVGNSLSAAVNIIGENGAKSDKKSNMEQRLNTLTDEIYKVLWILHRIQPFCCLVAPPGSLPRRYCSFEIANRTVEKKFLSGLLETKFVKFQLDNLILDFVPHSHYYNESIFSERLSKLRHDAIGRHILYHYNVPPEKTWQTTGVNYKEKSFDDRTGVEITKFSTILDILQWRVDSQENDFAYGNGCTYNTVTSTANQNRKFSWQLFDSLIASYVKKIVDSKTPLRRGDYVIVMADNKVEYVAMIMACFSCRLIAIPLPLLNDQYSSEEANFLISVIRSYNVQRIFADYRAHAILEQNAQLGVQLKKYKNLPKVTVFSKLTPRAGYSVRGYQKILLERYGPIMKDDICTVWIDREHDAVTDLNVVMSHGSLLMMCKVLKETLHMSSDNPLFSMCCYTVNIGFLYSCMLGIYVGTTTNLFSPTEFNSNPNELLVGLQNTNVKDIVLTPDILYIIMDRGTNIIEKQKKFLFPNNKTKNSKAISAGLQTHFLQDIHNIMIPFRGRPRFQPIKALLEKYPLAGVSPIQLNYVYQHHFNPFISLRSYMGIPPVDIYLDPVSLREGVLREMDPNTIEGDSVKYTIHLQDSGIVPACTEVSIVNPETMQPCYENEIGEIWCCSEGNIFDYAIGDLSRPSNPKLQENVKNGFTRNEFINRQLRAKMQTKDNGLSYLRTVDLGFIKKVIKEDGDGKTKEYSVLYVLGSINETIDILGLTHFVIDLEGTVRKAHQSIRNCMISKCGGLLCCLVECNPRIETPEYSSLTPLIVNLLFIEHGIILDLCCFVKPNSMKYMVKDWQINRMRILGDWLAEKLDIESQFGVNIGENNSIYLLSDFENNRSSNVRT